MKTPIAAFPASAALRETIRAKNRASPKSRRIKNPSEIIIGKWTIKPSDNGDLIAVHEDGTTKVVASLIKEN